MLWQCSRCLTAGQPEEHARCINTTCQLRRDRVALWQGTKRNREGPARLGLSKMMRKVDDADILKPPELGGKTMCTPSEIVSNGCDKAPVSQLTILSGLDVDLFPKVAHHSELSSSLSENGIEFEGECTLLDAACVEQ